MPPLAPMLSTVMSSKAADSRSLEPFSVAGVEILLDFAAEASSKSSEYASSGTSDSYSGITMS